MIHTISADDMDTKLPSSMPAGLRSLIKSGRTAFHARDGVRYRCAATDPTDDSFLRQGATGLDLVTRGAGDPEPHAPGPYQRAVESAESFTASASRKAAPNDEPTPFDVNAHAERQINPPSEFVESWRSQCAIEDREERERVEKEAHRRAEVASMPDYIAKHFFGGDR